ncbi:hypothetical protein HHL19_35750 [Streptomyces sp. R302]|uniref:hypothetical protein n=1 Tax=unclassified Streptomyces TaxID=2593676 RepID=UPI00145D013D|nr:MULTISPECIES: hypothetical protein [unclassified Streptomyces]NML55105.1 hypothetical protein [Streptomyces sp. R301]NML83865.1 hypothetical protein [Streptomyces sp. R302]
MATTFVTSVPITDALADLLPARRGTAWKVESVPPGDRTDAPTARLVQNGRALEVVTRDDRVQVYADRPGMLTTAPDMVVAVTTPAPDLAALVLRVVLPRLEREAARTTEAAHGPEQVLIDAVQGLNEVTSALIDHGAHPEGRSRIDRVGVTWGLPGDPGWGLWAFLGSGNLTLSYSSPLEGLYAFLPVVLPSPEGHAPDDAGSEFTRHLTGRFPQLRSLDDDMVGFGRRDEPSGWIALPDKAEPTDYADDSRPVVAEFSGLGVDLLLTAVAHLV